MSEPTAFPTAAQLAKEQTIRMDAIRTIAHRMNLRVKAIELAAQFPHAEPMKLAQQIFDFIVEDSDE